MWNDKFIRSGVPDQQKVAGTEIAKLEVFIQVFIVDMMKSLTKSIFVVFALLNVASCSLFEKDEESPRDYLAEIEAFAVLFEQEALQRGLDLSEQMASIRFETVDEIMFEGNSLCGFAPWYDDPTTTERTISITVDEECWISRPVEDNEALIFHELGHMVLDRDHRDDRLPNNNRSSIMVGSNLAGLYVGNAGFKRSYYIDELFNAETPAPDWAQ